MDPYAVLGIPRNSSKKQAKAAYRRLAMLHHPDRGGSQAKFQEILAAWNWIQEGRFVAQEAPKPKNEEPYRSSFGGAPVPPPVPPKAPRAKRARPILPTTVRVPNPYGSAHYVLRLEITPDQAAFGCIIPFMHFHNFGPVTLEHEVRPGTTEMDTRCIFDIDPMIGAQPETIFIRVIISIQEDKSECETRTGNALLTLRVSALALFTGGAIDVKDHLGEKVQVIVQPGWNPNTPIIIIGKGYGTRDQRADLHIKIEPVFKAADKLNDKDKFLLSLLNKQVQQL